MKDNHFAVMIAGLVKPGMEGYMKHFLKELMEHSAKDEGCIAYNIHQSIDNPLEFMVYMLWNNEQAFNRHNEKPEMQQFKNELSKQMFEMQSPKTFWRLIE
jgi:quinol monooxygenase YgiN